MLHKDLETEEIFLQLVRLGIGHSAIALPDRIDWDNMETFAANLGPSAIIIDGIDKLPESSRPPKALLLRWIGNTLQGYDYRYEQYCRTIAEMSAWHNANSFKMMVLKGDACSLNWPKPEYRPCGDIDIWQFGKQREADAVLQREKGIKIDNSHHHHTVFYWRDFMVENNYDFIEVHHHSSSPALEKILKEKGQDDSYSVEVSGERVYVPSPNLHALFLLRHSMEHFASTGITLRQLLDWAFFAEKQGKDVECDWLEGVLDQFGMIRLYEIFNAICIEDLGFEAGFFHRVQFESMLKERVLNDILSLEFSGEEPKRILCRVLFKFHRWKANGWKQELCYNGSRLSAFWYATWNHLIKLASI